MRAVCKSLAVQIALVAMLLRALVPAGWMPNTAGADASPFIICHMQDGAPSQHPDHDRASAPCVFAAAAQLAAPDLDTPSIAPSALADRIDFRAVRVEARSLTLFRANTARAPPAFA